MGVLVMFMAAGFCMLEVGLVRRRNASTICLKNISIYAIAGLMYWLIGYNLMYGGGSFFGTFGVWSADDSARWTPDMRPGLTGFSRWCFRATTASIVSGTLAERIRLWPF